MTPEEKAKELVNKFTTFSLSDEDAIEVAKLFTVNRDNEFKVLKNGLDKYAIEKLYGFSCDLDKIPFSMKYGLLVDFFDSNGIHIDAHRTIKGYSVMIQHGKEMEFIELDKDYETRSEARKNAILKANNLFNENNY